MARVPVTFGVDFGLGVATASMGNDTPATLPMGGGAAPASVLLQIGLPYLTSSAQGALSVRYDNLTFDIQ